MKQIFYILLIFVLLHSCSAELKVELENPLNFDRTEELVELPLDQLVEQLSTLKEGETYAVILNDEVIPSQLTSDGKLIFQSQLKALESKKFIIKKNKETIAEPLVFGRVFTERKEDFAWENDKLGFRFYGHELQALDGPSNGLDLWYKRTDKLVLNEWYRKSVEEHISYHVDHGEGCDPYGVGHSLGAGAMAPFINDELVLNGNYLTATILDEGPLRFSARLDYPALQIDGKSIAESRTVTLDAGSQFTKIEQYYAVNETMTVAAGIVKRNGSDSIVYRPSTNYFFYQEPATDINGQIFLAVIMPDGLEKVKVHAYDYLHPLSGKEQHFEHSLGVATYHPGKPLVYYTGFAWTKAGFHQLEDFQAYTAQFEQALNQGFVVKYK